MQNKTLLLVEDEVLIAAGQKRGLEAFGYKVLHAPSGEIAIEMVKKIPEINLILMDIDLGHGIDGTVAAERILRENLIPIVFLSSHAEPEIVAKTEKITSYGYVVKNTMNTVLDASIKMAFKLFDSQRMLEKTTQLLESTGKLAKVGGWQVDLASMKLSWTLQTFEIAEMEPPIEPPLAEGINLFAPSARATITEALDKAMEFGTPYDLELPIITAKGRNAWVQTQGFVEMKQGKAVRLFGTFQDITERKTIELELDIVRKNSETIINSSKDTMWSLNPDYTLILANSFFIESFFKTTGVRLASGDSLLMQELFPAEYLAFWKSQYDRGLAGEIFEIEIEIPTPVANVNDIFLVSFQPILSNDKTVGLCCYGRNITEKRQSEERIKSLLNEKELILREVHHRIKNNFAMITSFLKLQANSIREKTGKDALVDASGRVQSMALLYNKLYQSDDYGKLSFKDYLKQLVGEIQSNFYSHDFVDTEIKIDDFLLETKKIQTVGIILNEILTNIMKYAFVGREHGKILISGGLKEGLAFFEVKDNGVGISESALNGGENTFGLLLIRELTAQLRGTVSIKNENGTSVFVSFPL